MTTTTIHPIFIISLDPQREGRHVELPTIIHRQNAAGAPELEMIRGRSVPRVKLFQGVIT
jgi:hypothetical protein